MNVQLPEKNKETGVYFTGDSLATTIRCQKNSYIQMKATMRVYPFSGGAQPFHYSSDYEYYPFNGKTTVYLGKIADSYFYIPELLTEVFNFGKIQEGMNAIPLYRPLEMDITFHEINLENEKVIHELSFTNIKFIKGYSNSLLKNKLYTSRLGSNSLVSYSSFLPMSLYKNNQLLYKNNTKNDVLYANLYKDSLKKSGDVFNLKHSDSSAVVQKWISFPQSLQSVHIVWLDENLTLQIFEMTGEYLTNLQHNLLTNVFIRDQVEIKKVLSSEITKKITLNSGYILEDDINILSSIIKSARSWISFDHLNSFTSFICNTKELEKKSDQSIHSYELEIILNDNVEIHKKIEIESDFVFDFIADGTNDNTLNLTYAFPSGKIEIIDWGDGTVNSELSHRYLSSQEYRIQVKIPNLTRVHMDHLKIRSVIKLPKTLDQLSFTGCCFTSESIHKLLSLVLAHNPKRGLFGATSGNLIYRIAFYSFICIDEQKPGVILTPESIELANKLSNNRWFIDYHYANSENHITSSRYQDPDNALKYWNDEPSFEIDLNPRFLVEGEIRTTNAEIISRSSGVNADDTMLNYFGAIWQHPDDFWLVENLMSQPVKSQFQLPMSFYSKGCYNLKIGQMMKPVKINNFYEYNHMSMNDFVLDVIAANEVLFAYYDRDYTIEVSGAPSIKSFDILPLNNALYKGLGKTNDTMTPKLVFDSQLKDTTINNICWEAEESGEYEFSFINFIVDFKSLREKMSGIPGFYLAYYKENGDFELSNNMGINDWANFRVEINRVITLNINKGDKIIPLLNGTWETPLTPVKGTIKILAGSRLIISKK
ncbi:MULTISPECIES: hypothetical protein [unclassified Apibacter]|uniref:hypothetical protein n=1 Tax=unclassified Apibacter TaxID=2630820 RepID=UPI00135E7164|nr:MULTISPECIES: hypothetical protein [unclassified Apibacter]MXP04776.1 hypothetical protein [Apibacter sp. B3546]MXP12346.1 hypothetical protein [Apibacter sp. B3239]